MLIPIASMRQSAVREALQSAFGLQASSIKAIGDGPSGCTFEVILTEPTTKGIIFGNHSTPIPGTTGIPSKTKRLIFRFVRPLNIFHEETRVENIVAAMELARYILPDGCLPALVPQVYGFHSGLDEAGVPGWIVEEWKEGKVLAEDFPSLSLTSQRVILAQLAAIVKAFQDYELPSSGMGFAGWDLDLGGLVVTAVPSLRTQKKPFQSVAEFYTNFLGAQFINTHEHEHINGWKETGLRNRLVKFIRDGSADVFAEFPTVSPTFVHGGLELDKILYDPSNLWITAILDYSQSHISIPAVEFLYSFSSIYGKLSEPHYARTASLLKTILDGFPEGASSANSSSQDVSKWAIAEAWNDELTHVGAVRPSTTNGIKALTQMHWFIEELAPRHLYDPDMLEGCSSEEIRKSLMKAERRLRKYLDAWGY